MSLPPTRWELAGEDNRGYAASRAGSRTYPADEFVADPTAAGPRVTHRFGSSELHEPHDAYAVWLLASR